MSYIKNNLVDSDSNMFSTVDSLTEINNKITVSKNITLKKVNVKPYRFDKTNMDKDLTEDKLYKIKGQINERKITLVKLESILLNKTHSFHKGNGRTSKILFASDDKIIELFDETKN